MDKGLKQFIKRYVNVPRICQSPPPPLIFLPSSLSQSSEIVLEAIVARADKPVGKQVFSCPAGGWADWCALSSCKEAILFININPFLSIKICIVTQ